MLKKIKSLFKKAPTRQERLMALALKIITDFKATGVQPEIAEGEVRAEGEILSLIKFEMLLNSEGLRLKKVNGVEQIAYPATGEELKHENAKSLALRCLFSSDGFNRVKLYSKVDGEVVTLTPETFETATNICSPELMVEKNLFLAKLREAGHEIKPGKGIFTLVQIK